MKAAPSIKEFKAWSRRHYALAHAVCVAQAFAQCQRERVDAYILPIFKRYTFPVAAKWQRAGLSIDKPDHIYLCDDEVLCANYFQDCDTAHREHGFTGKYGYCPALIAEALYVDAQRALIEAAKPLFGIEAYQLIGDQWKQYVDLLLGACLKSDEKAAA